MEFDPWGVICHKDIVKGKVKSKSNKQKNLGEVVVEIIIKSGITKSYQITKSQTKFPQIIFGTNSNSVIATFLSCFKAHLEKGNE